jgi:hypothetical protein
MLRTRDPQMWHPFLYSQSTTIALLVWCTGCKKLEAQVADWEAEYDRCLEALETVEDRLNDRIIMLPRPLRERLALIDAEIARYGVWLIRLRGGGNLLGTCHTSLSLRFYPLQC